MIKIREIPMFIPTVELYNSQGFIGEVNEFELLDVRRQICEENVDDYYVLLNDDKIRISADGEWIADEEDNHEIMKNYFGSEDRLDMSIAVRIAQRAKKVNYENWT